MELVLRLDALPVLRERLVAELDAAEVGTDASPEQLYALTAMNDVVREAKRAAPILPLVFGTAARDFELGGYTFPQALGVWMALSLSNRDIRHFAEPERFDPDRYAAPRAERLAHPHAWAPQGSGPSTGHRCLGLDYSTVFPRVILAQLDGRLNGRRWRPLVPASDRSYNEAMDDVQIIREHMARRDRADQVAAASRVQALREAVPVLVERLRDAWGARRVWLFGSLAWGTADGASDIDLAVEGLRSEDYFSALADLLERAPGRVDLVTLEDAPASLAARIRAEGSLLHGR